jgi:nucleoside-diphosphate-sugar epimerase
MRIFCTGASGYIGGSIAVALAAAGSEVSGLARSERSADTCEPWALPQCIGRI